MGYARTVLNKARGIVVDIHTGRALAWAQKRAGVKFDYSQGSYHHGSVSGSTHDEAGAVDLRIQGWGKTTIDKVVHALRDAGFAAWHRDAQDGFDPHIHAILIGLKGLSTGARWQTLEYDSGRNGLNNRKPDRDAYRPKPKVKWSSARLRPIAR